MARACSENAWLNAAKGNFGDLDYAFDWSTTKEGHDYWRTVFDKWRNNRRVDSEVVKRVAELYVEWKLIGDFDESEIKETT